MPGVTFSRNSAQRISAAVRKIEEIPHGKQSLQRRRAGGLGRSTLWEVTAVQTGPETVTIKRVSNIAFDLNDPSEKVDILYDPDNEPAVGDRGLLIRLGEGPLFFFKRDMARRIFTDEYCYVKSDDPTSAFGYPSTAIVFLRSSPTPIVTHIAVFKFASRLPIKAIEPEASLVVGAFKSVGDGIIWNYTPKAGFVSTGSGYSINEILEDFDPSTLTFNDYSVLAKSVVASTGGIGSVKGDGRAMPGTTNNFTGLMFDSVGKMFVNGAYGFAIISSGGASPPQATVFNITTTFRSSENPTGVFRTWIQWWEG